MNEHAGYWINTTVEQRCEHVGKSLTPTICPYCEVEQLTLPDIHRGKYHHPDCNYWKWDWEHSWDATDCNCEDVGGAVES